MNHAGRKKRIPTFAAVASTVRAVLSRADSNPVAMIGTCSPSARIASTALGRSVSTFSGSTWPPARTVSSIPS